MYRARDGALIVFAFVSSLGFIIPPWAANALRRFVRDMPARSAVNVAVLFPLPIGVANACATAAAELTRSGSTCISCSGRLGSASFLRKT